MLVLWMDSVQCLGGEADPKQTPHGPGLLMTDGLGWQCLAVKWPGQWNKIAERLFWAWEFVRSFVQLIQKSFSVLYCVAVDTSEVQPLPVSWFPEFGFDMLRLIYCLCWVSPHHFTANKLQDKLRANSPELNASFPLIYTGFALGSEPDKLSCSMYAGVQQIDPK